MRHGIEFLILHRVPEKGGFWQNLSGGVEEGETLAQTLKRELYEELGINEKQVKRIIENVYFYEWSKPDGQKIKEWVFGVEILPETEIRLSEEHDDFKWCSAEDAKRLLKWEGTRIAIDKTVEKIRSV